MTAARRCLFACLAFALLLVSHSATFAQVTKQATSPQKSSREQFLERATNVEARLDQPYAGNTNPRQMVDVYLPKQRNSQQPLPVLVFIHGGGWSGGSRDGYAGAAMAAAQSGNYVAVSVGYRLSNEAKWPAQIHDCKAAIRWIKGHAKDLNIDPNKIGAQGGSAGGHLVTLLGLTAGNKELEGDLGEFTSQSSSVACVVNFCGPSDLTTPLMQGDAAKNDDPAVSGLIGGSLKDKLDVAKSASPLTYVSATAAPILTVHGTKDLRVNYTNAERLHAALTAAGAKTWLQPVTDGGHSIGGGPELVKRVAAFFDRELRGIAAEISTTAIPTVQAANVKK